MSNYRSQSYASALLIWGNIFSHPLAIPVNAFFSIFYLVFIIPFVQVYLDVEWVFARRSVLDIKNFNIFFSDLDLGIIIHEKSDLPLIRKRLNHLKSRLHFLGEAEIYTASEYQLLQTKLCEQYQLYCIFREIRKVGWMDQAYKTAPTEYHAQKARRAIKKSLSKLKIESNDSVYSSFKKILEEASQSYMEDIPPELDEQMNKTSGEVQCPYFGKFIVFSETPGPLYPALPAKLALTLFALTPPLERWNLSADQLVAELRKIPSISAVFRDLSTIEFLIFQSVFRSLDTPEEWQCHLYERLGQAFNHLKLPYHSGADRIKNQSTI